MLDHKDYELAAGKPEKNEDGSEVARKKAPVARKWDEGTYIQDDEIPEF